MTTPVGHPLVDFIVPSDADKAGVQSHMLSMILGKKMEQYGGVPYTIRFDYKCPGHSGSDVCTKRGERLGWALGWLLNDPDSMRDLGAIELDGGLFDNQQLSDVGICTAPLMAVATLLGERDSGHVPGWHGLEQWPQARGLRLPGIQETRDLDPLAVALGQIMGPSWHLHLADAASLDHDGDRWKCAHRKVQQWGRGPKHFNNPAGLGYGLFYCSAVNLIGTRAMELLKVEFPGEMKTFESLQTTLTMAEERLDKPKGRRKGARGRKTRF